MKVTFNTAGTVETVFKEDGTIFGYKVGKKSGSTIFVTKLIDEFFEENVAIYVDAWGSFWAKKA